MVERSVDVENIELTIDDQNEEGVNIDIQQSTDQVRVLEIGAGPVLSNGHVPSQDMSTSDGKESADEHEEGSFETSEEHTFNSEERVETKQNDGTKQYEEWIFVDVNKSTHEIKENLLVMSSVYGQEECCVML